MSHKAGVDMSKNNYHACILASGIGSRFKSSTPKQFKLLNGKPIYLYTLETARASNIFDYIEVKVQKQHSERVQNEINSLINNPDCEIVVGIGEDERIENIKSFINDQMQLHHPDTNVAIFDANRPFIPVSLLQDLKDACARAKASCPARPVIDGCCYVDGQKILEIPSKENLFSLQTPEFINLGYYKECEESLADNKSFMGIAELVIYSRNNIEYVRSDERSFKVTEPRDWVYAEYLVKADLIWD